MGNATDRTDDKTTKIKSRLLLLKKVSNARLGESDKHPLEEDPSPTIPTHRMKEEKGKTVVDKRARPIKRH